MKNVRPLMWVAGVSFLAGAALVYLVRTPWISDMANQPSIKPQEMPLLPPRGSVPTDLLGGPVFSARTTQEPMAGPGNSAHVHEVGSAAGHQHPHDRTEGKHDHGSHKPEKTPAKAGQHDHGSHTHAGGGHHDHGAASMPHHNHGASGGDGHAHGHGARPGGIVNPIKATETSVQKGHQLFTLYCRVCHGTEGRGGMPMESKLSGIPKFTAELLRGVDDEHMFTMVTSGHGPMPGYGEALSPEERWHVTNYIRALQKTLAAESKVAAPQGGLR